MRDAPSLVIVPELQSQGAIIQAFDPEGRHEAAKMLKNVQFMDGPYDALKDADALVLLTEWDPISRARFWSHQIGDETPVIIDLRNIYNPGRYAPPWF